MKRRHLLAGLTVVLAISLAVPALGAGGLAGLKSIVKKALATATSAQSTATNAQQAAGNAQDAAKTAQTTAGAAANKANSAENAAAAAQGRAAAAQDTANTAQTAANAAQTAANTANTTANTAATTAAAKFGDVKITAPVPSTSLPGHIGEAIAQCPPEYKVIAGGYEFTTATAEVHQDHAVGTTAWQVQAQAPGGGDDFAFNAFAVCIK
jgi:hypothetical protein